MFGFSRLISFLGLQTLLASRALRSREGKARRRRREGLVPASSVRDEASRPNVSTGLNAPDLGPPESDPPTPAAPGGRATVVTFEQFEARGRAFRLRTRTKNHAIIREWSLERLAA